MNWPCADFKTSQVLKKQLVKGKNNSKWHNYPVDIRTWYQKNQTWLPAFSKTRPTNLSLLRRRLGGHKLLPVNFRLFWAQNKRSRASLGCISPPGHAVWIAEGKMLRWANSGVAWNHNRKFAVSFCATRIVVNFCKMPRNHCFPPTHPNTKFWEILVAKLVT